MPLTGSVLGLVVVRDAVVSFCTGWPSFFFLLPPKQPKFSPKTQRFATDINYRSGSWLIGLVNIARAARVRVLPNDGKRAFQLWKHWDLRMRRLDMNDLGNYMQFNTHPSLVIWIQFVRRCRINTMVDKRICKFNCKLLYLIQDSRKFYFYRSL